MQWRDYRESDRHFIVESLQRLQDEMVATDPLRRARRSADFAESSAEHLLALVSENNGKIIVVEDNGTPVAFIGGWVRKQTELDLRIEVPALHGVIEDLFVEEAYRRRGIGTELMKAMEQYLKSKGCQFVSLSVFGYNTKARRLYANLGYTDVNVTMMKKV